MKFYNPFKPHVVKYKDWGFAVRKYILFKGWRYLDQRHQFDWWSEHIDYFYGWCVRKTIKELYLKPNKREHLTIERIDV